MRFQLTDVFICCAMSLLAGCGAEPRSAPLAPAATDSQPAPPKILQFYVSPGSVHAGEETTLCYGVENTDTVTLEPNIKDIKPGLNRCFAFAPKKAGIVKLTATGPGGEAHEQLAVEVLSAKRPKDRKQKNDLVTVFLASQDTVPKGTPVTLCYTVEGAENVEIDPPVIELEPVARCFSTRVEQTTTFKITATNGDHVHSKSLEVRVE